MSNIEKIVADYETCKKAWEIGLKLWDIEGNFNTVFAWWQCLHDYETNIAMQSEWDSEVKLFYHKMYPAPIAEEVPLPDYFRDDINVSVTCDRNYYYVIYTKDNKKKKHQLDRFKLGLYAKFNEATARLKIAIWLIENVPEARAWYVKNNYIIEEEK